MSTTPAQPDGGDLAVLPVEDVDLSELLDPTFDVVLWNDPVTLMDYVTFVLKAVFTYPEAKAHELMMTVHTMGRAIVWTGPQVEAEHHCAKLQARGLMSTVEPSA